MKRRTFFKVLGALSAATVAKLPAAAPAVQETAITLGAEPFSAMQFVSAIRNWSISLEAQCIDVSTAEDSYAVRLLPEGGVLHLRMELNVPPCGPLPQVGELLDPELAAAIHTEPPWGADVAFMVETVNVEANNVVVVEAVSVVGAK